MAGTKLGGQKVREKNLAKDPDYYKKLGKKGAEGWLAKGRKPRGFSVINPEQHKIISAKGGRIFRKAKW